MSATASSKTPLRWGLAVFPWFEVLDCFGPLEAMNTLSRSTTQGLESNSLVILAKTLNPVSSGPIPPYEINANFQQSIVPTHTFDDAPPIDVLLVPGGFGTGPNLPGGGKADVEDVVEFIRKVYPSLKYLITVCTGAVLAAEAGVLDGHCATTNKTAFATVAAKGPRTYWVAHARWVVSKNIWTTSGVSAGTDGVIAWIAQVYGDDTAEYVCNSMEYIRNKEQWNDPFCELNKCVDIPPTNW